MCSVRVSTEDQAREGFSLSEQEKRLRTMCEYKDYEIYKIYKDAGISAKTENHRPAFEELLQDIRDKKCNTIVVLKLDRLTRSVYDMEHIMKFLNENDAYLDCANDDINTTNANGKMVARLLTIKGTSSIVEDTKNLYLELFEDARIKYNEKQTRNDRKIENYFNHISNDNKRDLACEIIIELGDMDFWADKDDKFKHKMVEVFKEQILDLEEVVLNFKIANATIHFDESSPHLHIVGVPFKDGIKNGMEKQAGKSDVFNKISLKEIQDKMRVYCINSFNRIYHLNYTLKIKEEGRNDQHHLDHMMKMVLILL